jgi:hypothetical protein
MADGRWTMDDGRLCVVSFVVQTQIEYLSREMDVVRRDLVA